MNKCCFVGWIADDLELKEGNNTKYLRFRVAVRRPTKGQQKYDYVPLVAFGKTAEFINKYFKRGDYISVVGAYRTSRYTTSNDETRYSHDFWVEDAGFCSPANNENGAPKVAIKNDPPANENDLFDDLPF